MNAGAAASFPSTLEVDGFELVLNGIAVRSTLIGLVKLYRIGLYLPRRSSDVAEIAQTAPKALHIELMRGTAGREVPREWFVSLAPQLDAQERRALRDMYGSLEAADLVAITYTARSGSVIAVNGREVIRKRGPALMDAFMEQWVGRHPTSARVKAALLGVPF